MAEIIAVAGEQGARRAGTGMYMEVHEDSGHRVTQLSGRAVDL